MDGVYFAVGLLSFCAAAGVLVAIGIAVGTYISRRLEISGARHKLNLALLKDEHETLVADQRALLQLPTIATGDHVVVKTKTYPGARKC